MPFRDYFVHEIIYMYDKSYKISVLWEVKEDVRCYTG